MLENLQKKPKNVRHNWALGISIFVTFIILSVWLSTFSLNIGNQDTALKENTEYSRYGSTASIYFNIKKGITETFSLATDLF